MNEIWYHKKQKKNKKIAGVGLVIFIIFGCINYKYVTNVGIALSSSSASKVHISSVEDYAVMLPYLIYSAQQGSYAIEAKGALEAELSNFAVFIRSITQILERNRTPISRLICSYGNFIQVS